MKLNPIFLFFIFISFVISCGTINENSLPGIENNVYNVKKIIDNYSTLETYLNNKTICDTNFLEFYFKFAIPKLKEHIIKNKFYEGYKFEILDSIDKGVVVTGNEVLDTNNYVFFNLIKIRSNFNNDIIWFIFNYHVSQKIWKLGFMHYCNNFNELHMGKDIPCDKK